MMCSSLPTFNRLISLSISWMLIPLNLSCLHCLLFFASPCVSLESTPPTTTWTRYRTPSISNSLLEVACKRFWTPEFSLSKRVYLQLVVNAKFIIKEQILRDEFRKNWVVHTVLQVQDFQLHVLVPHKTKSAPWIGRWSKQIIKTSKMDNWTVNYGWFWIFQHFFPMFVLLPLLLKLLSINCTWVCFLSTLILTSRNLLSSHSPLLIYLPLAFHLFSFLSFSENPPQLLQLVEEVFVEVFDVNFP